MIPRYKQIFCIKNALYLFIVAFFISSDSSLKAANSGGNDTIASSIKSPVSIDNQKVLIRDMTVEQLTALVDKALDMDVIPVDLINEINVAVAKIDILKVKEIITVKMLEINRVPLYIDDASAIPTVELRANENIISAHEIVKTLEMNTVSLHIDAASSIPIVELRANENIISAVEKVKMFEMNAVSLNINDVSFVPVVELRANENIVPTLEAELSTDDFYICEESNNLIPEKKVVKKLSPLALLKMNVLSNATVNAKSVAPAPKIKSDDYTTPPAITNLNIAIPSADYYVSWEINKLFPEKDMLKINGDTSITLVLLSKEHHHYFHPFNGPITSNFGWRDSAQHNGIDIDLNRGDKVSAAFDGMVRVARRYGGFGNMVIIRHYNGLETVYAHLSKIKVKPGQLISSGDLVGLGGSTGRSTGSHLHFEVRFKGVPINPKYLISISEQKLMCDEFTLKKTKWGLAVYPKNTTLYIVEKGDTVFEIAKRFGTTTASIKEMNHLNSGRVRLKAGQLINVAH